ncbi:MAG: hypothetical protein WCA04_15310, partial [Geobacteraceae bacterium]
PMYHAVNLPVIEPKPYSFRFHKYTFLSDTLNTFLIIAKYPMSAIGLRANNQGGNHPGNPPTQGQQ